MTETWYTETSQTGREHDWRLDTSGPHAGYDTRGEALAWGRKLLVIHPHVRLLHTTKAYEAVTAETCRLCGASEALLPVGVRGSQTLYECEDRAGCTQRRPS